MLLIASIAIVCLLLTFASDIIKVLHISKFFVPLFAGQNNSSTTELHEQLRHARIELENVKNSPASGEYAQFIKKMRAEKKITEIEERLRSERNMGAIKGASIDLIAVYGLKALLSLTLLIISVQNRYTPVIIFDERFNFQPLEGLLSFPTGVPNAISVPVWVLSCNVTFRLVSSIIKGKK